MDNDTERQEAIRRLKAKREFRAHLITYLLVNVVLWIVWALTGAEADPVPWPAWVTVFWGLGLGFHAFDAFGAKPITEEEVQREMQRGGGTVADADKAA